MIENGETKIKNPEDKNNVICIKGDGNIRKDIVQEGSGNNSITITGNGNICIGITQK
jgi:hypothetical protein